MSIRSEDNVTTPTEASTDASNRGRKPALAYVIQVVAILSALNNLLEGVGALITPISPGEKIGTVVVSLGIAAASLYVFAALRKASAFGSKRLVSIYLWLMLLIYPIENAMRHAGMYAPAPHLDDNQLWGAAIAEMLRYVVFLFLICWVALSGGLVEFFSPRRPITLNAADLPPTE